MLVVLLVIAPPSQGLEPPANPGRFSLVPRHYSTGGKTRLGRINKTGNRVIRRLLVLGATSMVYRAEQWNSVVGDGPEAFRNGVLSGW